MARVFEPNEITEINGVMVENEFAIPPNAKVPQQAIMLYYNSEDSKWELSLWGGGIDGKGVVANGWECNCSNSQEEIIEKILPSLMQSIATDEMKIRTMDWGE